MSFDHLKKRKPLTPNQTLEDFIEGAGKDDKAKKARKRTSREDLLLIASGRNSNLYGHVKPSLIYLSNDIQQDIEKFCSGNKQSIFNYLIRLGLDKLIEDKKLVIVEPS